jgi:threonyl-tRNA synthetase
MTGKSLAALRQTSAEVMAAAVVELFPGTLLVQGQSTPLGFCYDFVFPFTFQTEFLTLIEERMRLIVKEGRPLKVLEMMPANAAAFLEHHGQPKRASAVRAAKSALVRIVQSEAFIDWCEAPCLVHTGEVGAFKLQDFSEKEKVTRLSGTAFFEKSALKQFLKCVDGHAEKDHVRLGDQLKLFSSCPESHWIWHPKGEALRQNLLTLWRREHAKQNFHFISRSAPCFTPPALLSRFRRLAETVTSHHALSADERVGLFQTQVHLSDRAYILCSEGELLEECISSLQFMIKISKMLSFEYRLVLGAEEAPLIQALKECQLDYDYDPEAGEAVLEMRLKDALGREWTGPSLRLEKHHSGERLLTRSTFNSIERMVALLVEQHAGSLPLWLAPEQLRVLVVGEQNRECAERVALTLQQLGWRLTIDARSARLGERVHDAMREKVPLCVLVGDREQKMGTVTIRAYGSTDEESVKVDELTFFTGNRKLDFEN